MASSRDRQRALARAKLERQMARRAAAARRRRQIQAGIAGFVALGLVVLGAFWLVSELGGDEDGKKKNSAKPGATPSPGACEYKAMPKKEASKERKDVGTPEAGAEARSGVRVLTLDTNRGAIKIQLDAEKAPCNTESLAHLTGKKFLDGSPCHRLTTQGLSVLQCGDPSGTGRGGPTYTTNDENLPVKQKPAYPKGVVAMANSGPATNGSQFFIVYADSQLDPNYTIVGEVLEGMEVVEKIAKGGVKGDNPGDGAPKLSVKIKTATVTEPQPKGDADPATEPSKS
ncbi:MAG: peptidylprolyl isomerase [Micromonosporaceae bacterium]|nr:peptidylprolyl isomerase [Micromonosporaceae bacterium]